jgi:serine O-acetyltransferase
VIFRYYLGLVMDRNSGSDHVSAAAEALVRDVLAEPPKLQHLQGVTLPNRDRVIRAIELMRQVIFPGYFGKAGWTKENVGERVEEALRELNEILYEQIRHCLRYRESISDAEKAGGRCEECDRHAAEIVRQFLANLPAARELLTADVNAAFEGDPAARNTDETIFCYPGVLAITVQRLAHQFYNLDVPMFPRIMTEWAHSCTGIDIHPGAKLGRGLMIDHGTGVVIGETTEIGSNVKIYQGVTLGALAPAYGQMLRGQKRHPTIEDDVTIYAGATILGGETVIGKGTVIGGNVFATQSVPPMHVVSAEPPKLQFRDRRKRQRGEEWFGEGI